MKRLIVYDLDGTLADTLEDIAESANHMLRQLRRPAVARGEVRRYVGHGVYQLIKDCLGTEDEAVITQGLAIYRAYYGQHMLDRTTLYPGAREALEYFRPRLQAVISNKPNPYSRDILAGLGVGHYFVDVIGGDDPYPKKPDPASLIVLLAQNAVAPGEAVFVGDSPVDIETAKRAGVPVVGMLHGLCPAREVTAARPDHLAQDFAALLALARTHAW